VSGGAVLRTSWRRVEDLHIGRSRCVILGTLAAPIRPAARASRAPLRETIRRGVGRSPSRSCSLVGVERQFREWHGSSAQAEFFRVLGHPARLRILELLRNGERSVGDLQRELGMDSSGTSQHLSAMRRQGVLDSRRVSTSVLYRITDPAVLTILEMSRTVLADQLRRTSVRLDSLADNMRSSSAA
jgi:DNA-binding transcriptional ArsR family regulator